MILEGEAMFDQRIHVKSIGFQCIALYLQGSILFLFEILGLVSVYYQNLLSSNIFNTIIGNWYASVFQISTTDVSLKKLCNFF